MYAFLCKYMQIVFQEAQTVTRKKKGPDVRQMRSAGFEQPRVPRLASPGLQCTGVAPKLTAIPATPFPGFGDSQSRQQCQRDSQELDLLWNLPLASSEAVPIYNVQEQGVYIPFSLKQTNYLACFSHFLVNTYILQLLEMWVPWTTQSRCSFLFFLCLRQTFWALTLCTCIFH